MIDLDLRLVRYFIAVADELHFGRAAARLYVSQPALSRQIRRLEEQLGEPLLVRDSRHVALTPRGERFRADAQRLLRIADDMQHASRPDGVRIAHVFELSTSRQVADAFAWSHPEHLLLEHAMDSITQLDALLTNRLDVGIVRVTPEMLRRHPTGWHHRLLRLEAMVLVGRPSDERTPTASFHARPLDVFGDPPESGTYNAHGQYLTALENHLGLSMRWLGTPGAFSHCLAHVSRATSPARYFEFHSYAERYAEAGMPVYLPTEVQPYYPWSLAWREDERSAPTLDLLQIATELGRANGWADVGVAATEAVAPPWLPPDEPAGAALSN